MQYSIDKGYDIKLAGKPAQEIDTLPCITAGYTLTDFRYLKPKVLVEEGQAVKKGTPLMCDKKNDKIVFVSPISGKVEKVTRGDRRVLLNVSVKREGDDKEEFAKIDSAAIASLDENAAKEALLSRGLWPMLRQRPYNKIADTDKNPVSIFISALESEPNAADPNFYLNDQGAALQHGVELLKKICPKIFMCTEGNQAASAAFSGCQGVEVHSFSGPHPRGNASLHIEKLDPITNSDKVVWTLRAQDVVSIGKTLLYGEYDAERIISWGGPSAKEAKYYRTTQLNCLDALPKDETSENRVISGSIVNGSAVDAGGYLGYYDNTVTCLPEGRKRRFLGWLTPGAGMLSASRVFLSALMPKAEYHLNTSTNGDFRAIVDSELYEKVQPLSVPTIFLYKALLAGDIEEAEKLGLWGIDAEDFALASFVCPSKNDFGGVVQNSFDQLYKEQ